MPKMWKLYSYAKAPVKTFALLHPVKMLKYSVYFLVGKTLFSWGKQVGRQEAMEEVEGTVPLKGPEVEESEQETEG